jgi:Flp pilus assembly protein TadG
VRSHRAGPRGERGAAVVDFVLVLVVLLPLFLGVLQVALVLHVRNTLTAAASEGARYAASADRPLAAGAARTREQIAGALAARFAQDVVAVPSTVQGAPGVEVRVAAEVPPLGLWGPAVRLVATGHAIEEVPPGGP